MAAAFTYQSLSNSENIRLLRLQRSDTGQLQCELEEIWLSDEYNPKEAPPKYTALSYTWGDSSCTVPILCNGKEMQITASLAEALEMSCHANPNALLWVDQICINQKDNDEKASQVSRMTLVYDRATSVLAWIGPERDDTGLAVEWIARVAALTSGFGNDIFRDYENSDARRKIESYEELTHAQSEELGVPFANEAAWAAFSAFYDRPWFERLWVVQEALPARDARVVCGSHTIPWHSVKAAAAWYANKASAVASSPSHKRTVDGISHASAMNLAWRMRSGSEFLPELMGQTVRPRFRWALDELLPTFRGRRAGDARDRMFALLGVSTLDEHVAKTPGLLAPDYRKSVREVFRDGMRGFIACEAGHSDALRLLWSAVPRSEERGWPAWVPDWRVASTGDVAQSLPEMRPGGLLHGTRHRYEEPRPGEEDELHVEGHILGKVVHHSQHNHFGPMITDIQFERDDLHWMYLERFDTDRYKPTGETVDTAFAVSLQGGQLHSEFEKKGTTPEKFGEILLPMIKVMTLPKSTPEEIRVREEALVPFRDLGLGPKWLEFTRQRYCLRRWFVSDAGFIGTGNYHLKEGDVIAALWGLNGPCILRPVATTGVRGRTGRSRYEFVGDAYVHGINEALEELEKDEDGKMKGVRLVLV